MDIGRSRTVARFQPRDWIDTMKATISRRDFLATTGVGALAGEQALFASEGPQVATPQHVKPLVIASANGNVSKDAAGRTCVEKAFELLITGTDVLAALVEGVTVVELDSEDTSVGYGGLPNADGVVQLDASVMHGSRRRAGGVACLEGVRAPSQVALKVMEETDHHLLVGHDAQRFARAMGFKIEEDLNTDKSRSLWLEWKRRTDPDHYLDPKRRAEAGYQTTLAMAAEGLIDPDHLHGTINCNGVNAKGELAGVTTTSGLAWKIPGRVGDSPILGAGLYVAGEVGAAGSTGRGEANLFSLGSFLVVEAMREGLSPKDGAVRALKRIAANTREKRLLDEQGQPKFNVVFYAVNAIGQHAAVSMHASSTNKPVRYAICTDSGARTVEADALYEGAPR